MKNKIKFLFIAICLFAASKVFSVVVSGGNGGGGSAAPSGGEYLDSTSSTQTKSGGLTVSGAITGRHVGDGSALSNVTAVSNSTSAAVTVLSSLVSVGTVTTFNLSPAFTATTPEAGISTTSLGLSPSSVTLGGQQALTDITNNLAASKSTGVALTQLQAAVALTTATNLSASQSTGVQVTTNLSNYNVFKTTAETKIDAAGGWTLAKSTAEALLSTVAAMGTSAHIINQSSNTMDWSNLKNVPAGFADGTDDGAGGAADGNLSNSATQQLNMSGFPIVGISSLGFNGPPGYVVMQTTQAGIGIATIPGATFYVFQSSIGASFYNVTFGSVASLGSVISTTGFFGPGGGLTAISSVAALAISTPNIVVGAITSALMQPSGATAASYTNANITIDAAGRVTAASNGSGGGGTTAWRLQVSSADTLSVSTGNFNANGSELLSLATFTSSFTVGVNPNAAPTWKDLTLTGTATTTTNDPYIGWLYEVGVDSTVYSTPTAFGYGQLTVQQGDSTGTWASYRIQLDSRATTNDPKIELIWESTGTHPDDIWAGVAIGTPSANGSSNANVVWQSSTVVICSSSTAGIAGRQKQSTMVPLTGMGALGGKRNRAILIKVWQIPQGSGGAAVHMPPTVYWDRRTP